MTPPSTDERRLLQQLAQGRPLPLIARDLRISRASVNRRLLELRHRYAAATNIHLAVIATRAGWI